jgi:quinol monooxygenase YgiN
MVIVRFQIRCKAEKAAAVRAALKEVVGPSRALAGVMHFDVGEDLTEAGTFIATEVFENRDALAKQEELPQVAAVLALLGDSLAADPEATIFEASSSEPWG